MMTKLAAGWPLMLLAAGAASAQAPAGGGSCADLSKFEIPGAVLSITKTELIPAGVPKPPQGAPQAAVPAVSLPAHCRVEGVIDPRTGVDARPYGIGFALALPEDWNGRFLFQGGGGLNGSVGMPLGAQAAGDKPALARGFAVVSTDSGHKGSVFDGYFFADQQASLDFYYIAIGRVAQVAKAMIARHYGRPAAHSYYSGCSTGGREGMIFTQRYPNYFDGVIVGNPAIRTGHSNLALAFIGAVFEQATPKDAAGKPAGELFSESDKNLIVSSLLGACDGKDGIQDGMIFNSRACAFDPASLACSGAKTAACLSAQQVSALKTAFAGPKDHRGVNIYPGFPYDAGIGQPPPGIPGLLSGPRIPVPVTYQASTFDAGAEAARLTASANERMGDSTWTNLSSFSGHGGKVIYYHGMSDAWFSPLDTLGYYEKMTSENGGRARVEPWARLYLAPGMGHCGGGSAALDRFDMLTAVTEWVESGTAPDSVVATGRAFPGRSRPLCAYPRYAHYTGQGDPNDARNYQCRE